MPQIVLTDISVKTLTSPPSGQVTYWDQKLPGFGCRVSQGGQKTFIVMYGPRDARRRKVVGKYPHQNLKTARGEARKALASVALGIIEEPAAQITFDEARDQFLLAAERKNRPRTVADYRRLLTRHFKFGKRQLADIQRIELQRRLASLGSTPTEQRHADTIIRIFFNWAYRDGLIENNPADRLPRLKAIPARERVLSDGELTTVLSNALKHPWPFGPIVALCILTGQRRSEIGMLERDWINPAERTITWPGEKVKNGRTTTIPYGDLTAAVLDKLPDLGEFVFAGRNRNNATFNGWAKCKRRFDEELGNVASYTLHDLRRTFSTNHAKLGTPIHVTERLLNHKSGSISGVAAIYNRHSYLPEMRAASELYEQHLAELID